MLVGTGPVTSLGALPLHARLTASSPADGSTARTVAEIVLTFSEQVNPSFVAVTVEGPEGDETDGGPAVDGREVRQALVSGLAAGGHVATFRVVSADGHPVSGTVRFTTTQGPTATESPGASASASPASSTGSRHHLVGGPESRGSAPRRCHRLGLLALPFPPVRRRGAGGAEGSLRISWAPPAADNVFDRAPLAQLAEQLTLNQRVRGSSP